MWITSSPPNYPLDYWLDVRYNTNIASKVGYQSVSKELKLIYIRIYQEDFDLLQALFTDSIGYNAAIREIVAAHCAKLRTQMETQGVKQSDFQRPGAGRSSGLQAVSGDRSRPTDVD